MPRVDWTAFANADLLVVVDYISDDNPDAALSLMDEIEHRVGNLAAQPKQGRPGRIEGTRELVIRPNFLVVYRETSEATTVLRLLHAAREWP